MPLVNCTDCGHELSTRAASCPKCGAPVSVSMTPEQAYTLHRIQAVQEVKDELTKWLTGRVWIAGVIGLFGLNALVTATIYGFLKEDLRLATRAAAMAEQSTQEAKASITKSTAFVEGLSSQAASVDNRFREVLARLDAESNHSREQALAEVAILTKRLTELESLAIKLPRESQSARDTVASFERKTSELSDYAKVARAAFEQNAKFEMNVLASAKDEALAQRLVKTLAEAGFRASVIRTETWDRKRIIDYGSNASEAASRARDLITPMLGGERLPLIPFAGPSGTYTSNYFAVILNPEGK